MLFLEKIHYEALKGDEDGGDRDFMYDVIEDEVDSSSDAREEHESKAHVRKEFAEIFLWDQFSWLVISSSKTFSFYIIVVVVV